MPPQSTSHYNGSSATNQLGGASATECALVKTLSVKEAAFRLRKSPDSIYAWLRRGRLKGWQPGGPGCQIQVVESSVEQAMKHLPVRPAMMPQAV